MLHTCTTFLQTTLFNKYPVENPHSILHSQTKVCDTAKELRKKVYFPIKRETITNFRSFFTKPKQFSFSHNQLRFSKVKCAQVLSPMFSKISHSPGQSLFSSKTQETRVLPLMSHCQLLQHQHENYCFASRIPWKN